MASATPRPRLLNLSNEEVIQINTDRISVGRSLKADYVINAPSISRIHFEIEKKDGLWVIKDHSRNGTYINKAVLKAQSKPLKSGDVINFLQEGGVSLRFDIPPVSSPTTNSEPNPDFAVSSTNGNALPSVSNDHSYGRRIENDPVTAAIMDLATPDEAVCPSTPTKKKRRLTLTLEERPEKSKRQCVLESSDLECSICQELFIKAATLNCSHSFCSFCINTWKTQRNHCPICRQQIQSVNPTIALDNFVKKLEESMDDESRKQREKLIKERPAVVPTPASAPPQIPEGLVLQDFVDSENLGDDYDDDDEDDEFFYDDDNYFDDEEEEHMWEQWQEFFPEIIHDYYY